MTVRLQPGDLFPGLEMNLPDQTLHLPADVAGGTPSSCSTAGPGARTATPSWPRSSAPFRSSRTPVSGSSRYPSTMRRPRRALVAKRGLTFPVGHGARAPAVAAVTGAFLNQDPLYLQSTGFVLDPKSRVVVSVYSSGAIGRLVPEDVLGLVRRHGAHAAA